MLILLQKRWLLWMKNNSTFKKLFLPNSELCMRKWLIVGLGGGSMVQLHNTILTSSAALSLAKSTGRKKQALFAAELTFRGEKSQHNKVKPVKTGSSTLKLIILFYSEY